jgi:hypothetical protein
VLVQQHLAGVSTLVSVHLYASAAFCALLPAALFFEPAGLRLLALSPWTVLLVACSAGLAFSLNVASMNLVTVTSGLTITIAGQFKDALLVIFGAFVFSVPVSALQVAGFTIIIACTVLYDQLRVDKAASATEGRSPSPLLLLVHQAARSSLSRLFVLPVTLAFYALIVQPAPISLFDSTSVLSPMPSLIRSSPAVAIPADRKVREMVDRIELTTMATDFPALVSLPPATPIALDGVELPFVPSVDRKDPQPKSIPSPIVAPVMSSLPMSRSPIVASQSATLHIPALKPRYISISAKPSTSTLPTPRHSAASRITGSESTSSLLTRVPSPAAVSGVDSGAIRAQCGPEGEVSVADLEFLAQYSGSLQLARSLHKDKRRPDHDLHVHVLYDLRTMLGPDRRTFIEIRAPGKEDSPIAAALVKAHSFETETMASDDSNLRLLGSVGLDIVFVHRDASARRAFRVVHELVRPGGFVVFDGESEINSPSHQPGSSAAALVSSNALPFEVWGTFRHVAHEKTEQIRHVFILRRSMLDSKSAKDSVVSADANAPQSPPFFAVAMATYRRPSYRSPNNISAVFEMLKVQTCQDFALYIVGDFYEPFVELQDMVAAAGFTVPVTVENLPEPGERGKPGMTGANLWMIGGSAAMTRGLQLAVAAGHPWVLHLDDDERWHPQRIQLLRSLLRVSPGAAFAFTAYRYDAAGTVLPISWSTVRGAYPRNQLPEVANVVHSAMAISRDIATVSRYPGYQGAGAEVTAGDMSLIAFVRDFVVKNPRRFTIMLPLVLGSRDGDHRLEFSAASEPVRAPEPVVAPGPVSPSRLPFSKSPQWSPEARPSPSTPAKPSQRYPNRRKTLRIP